MVPPSMTSVGEEEKFQLELTGGQFVSETKRRNVICFSCSSWNTGVLERECENKEVTGGGCK